MWGLDASAVIHAWDQYPIDQFPKVWDWLATLITKSEIMIPEAAFIEIERMSPGCAAFLHGVGITVIAPDNKVIAKVLEIANALGIVNDQYYAKGVDENDLFIIATAVVHGLDLVSNEGKQPNLPKQLPQYKIPAVCQQICGGHTCISFVELLKLSKVVFS